MFKVTIKKVILVLGLLGIMAVGCVVAWRRPSSRIINVSSMAQVRDIIFSDALNRGSVTDVLILFDIDNTLIEPTTDIASDQWFDACVRYCQAKGLAFQEAIEHVRPLWIRLLYRVIMQPVEAQGAQLVRELISARVPVIAVTARQLSLAALTMRQLHGVGIMFDSSVLAGQTIALNDGSSRMRFEHGILFCWGNDKGVAVSQLLDRLGFNPRMIVFIDDKESHLRSAAKIAKQRGCKFIGLRYGYLDEKVKNFELDDESIALLDRQMQPAPVRGLVHSLIPTTAPAYQYFKPRQS